MSNVIDEEDEDKLDEHIELSELEVESVKTNFRFYKRSEEDKAKMAWVERFELPMILSGK